MSSKAVVSPKPKFDWRHEAKQWFWLILLVLGIHSFIAKPFYIPSASMVSTLLVGDRLIVSKFPYGFSYLSPSVPILPKMDGRLFGSMPERGDVVVVKSPSDGADWIKRVIGLPGDTVAMVNGQVILNGRPIPKVPDGTAVLKVTPNTDCPEAPELRGIEPDGTAVCRLPRFRETLPSGRFYDVIDVGDGRLDNTDPVTVPEGHLFLMGDNRDNSSDSRVPPAAIGGGLGLVPVENLVGRAEFTTFSWDGTNTLWNPISWFTALRGERALRNLHPKTK
jgi:signal peptidase I